MSAELFVNYITMLEDHFITVFPDVVNIVGVGKHLLDQCPRFSNPHWAKFPAEYLLKLFLTKFQNRDLNSAKHSKKNRKLFKLSHLKVLLLQWK